MAETAARDRKNALANPYAQVKGEFEVAKLLAEPYLANPLRKHDCSPISDGASAMIIASDERARQLREAPGLDPRHQRTSASRRISACASSTRSRSTEIAAEKAGVKKDKIDVAEIYGPFTHQEILVEKALGVGREDAGSTRRAARWPATR